MFSRAGIAALATIGQTAIKIRLRKYINAAQTCSESQTTR